MIKPFLSLIVLLIVMVTSMVFHYIQFPFENSTKSLQYMTKLTDMAPLSLSVAYDESIYNRTYPEMQGLGRMGFIYEQ
ncbi:MAG TPA: hypothetical protein VIN02_08180 [Sulfurovum sp.]